MIASRSADASLRSALQVPFRHRRKFLAFFGTVVGLTVLALLWMPRTYRSEGKLLVRLGRENMSLDPTATLGSTPLLTVQQPRENEINSVIEIMHSQALIEKVVDALGPGRILGHDNDADGDREDAIRKMSRGLDVEAVRKSNILEVTYDANSPALAQAIVDKLIDCFLDEHIRLNRTPGAEQFLDEQTASIRGRLEGKEDQLRNLKNETGLASPDARRTIIVNRIGHLEDDLLQTTAALASKTAEVAKLKNQLADLPTRQVTEETVGFANEAADGMRQQLYALQLREKDLASKFTDDHPQLQEVRQQIAEAKTVLGEEKQERTQTKTGISKTHEENNLQLLKEEPVLASLQAKSKQLQSQLEEERHSLAKLNEDVLRVERLQRDVQLEDANYRRHVDSLEQARIDRAMAVEGKSNISIVQPATLDPKPIKPKAALNLLLAIVVGLIGGLGLTFAAERFDESLRSPHDVEQHLDLPVLADVPRLTPRQLMPAHREGNT